MWDGRDGPGTSQTAQRAAPNGDVSKRCPNMKLEGFSSSLRDQNQMVQDSCQEPLPEPVNWVSNDQLAKRGKSISKVENRKISIQRLGNEMDPPPKY